LREIVAGEKKTVYQQKAGANIDLRTLLKKKIYSAPCPLLAVIKLKKL
jgi:hypothetical protein